MTRCRYCLSWAILAVWTVLVVGVYGHTIDLAPSTKECFFEDLHAEDKVSIAPETDDTS